MVNKSHSSLWGLALGSFFAGLLVAQVMQPQPAMSQGNLEARVAALEAKLALVQVIEGELNGLHGPHWMIEGANVHIRSGSGATDDGGAPTGLGNLVVGYNEVLLNDLALGDRSGSHNLVVGQGHRFLGVGGFVAGILNTIMDQGASVSGGGNNTATFIGSISGGIGNTTTGLGASISGGSGNTASGIHASVSGGMNNVASGPDTSINGGANNTASGILSSISGGSSTAWPKYVTSLTGVP